VNLGDPAMILYTSGTTGPPKVQLFREGRGEVLGEESNREVDLGDPAMILYTSGSTGPPKVQLLGEGRVRRCWQERAAVRWTWGIQP
jgi:acyl-coenzyme A synthetase/AMP-(fatty) acid ligase